MVTCCYCPQHSVTGFPGGRLCQAHAVEYYHGLVARGAAGIDSGFRPDPPDADRIVQAFIDCARTPKKRGRKPWTDEQKAERSRLMAEKWMQQAAFA